MPSLDQRYVHFLLTVRPSPIHGWGVFADQWIPAYKPVIEYTGERIDAEETVRRSDPAFTCLFRVSSRLTIDGAVGGSGAELINHSCEPNLYSVISQDMRVYYYSKRVISMGEELTVDFNLPYTGRGVSCRCGAVTCRGTMERSNPRRTKSMLDVR